MPKNGPTLNACKAALIQACSLTQTIKPDIANHQTNNFWHHKTKTPLTNQLRTFLKEVALVQRKTQLTQKDVATLTTHYLWEHATQDITHLEIVSPDQTDYPFVIINRAGFLNEHSTWGEKVVFIDVGSVENTIVESYDFINNNILMILPSDAKDYYLQSCIDINPIYQVHPTATLQATDNKKDTRPPQTAEAPYPSSRTLN